MSAGGLQQAPRGEDKRIMKLSEIVCRETIVETLQTRDKKSVIRELVEVLKATKKLGSLKVNDVVEAVLKREKIGSTGMGGGVAVPHAKVDGAPAILGAFGRSVEGVDFSAVDGEKVHSVFLIVSPIQQANEHLAALKRISVAIKVPNYTKFLKAAKTSKDIFELFREFDEQTP